MFNYIFVYGTLKSNQPNHYLIANLINKGLFQYLGDGIMKESRPMVVATEFNIPYLLDVTGAGYKVKGEIYSFDSQESLATLDELESHPTYYERKLCKIIKLGCESNVEISCWVYLLTNFKSELLNYPYIAEYRNEIMVGKYVLPNDRPKDSKSSEFIVKNDFIQI